MQTIDPTCRGSSPRANGPAIRALNRQLMPPRPDLGVDPHITSEGTMGGRACGHPVVVGTHNRWGDCSWGPCKHFWLASIIGSVCSARACCLVWDACWGTVSWGGCPWVKPVGFGWLWMACAWAQPEGPMGEREGCQVVHVGVPVEQHQENCENHQESLAAQTQTL